MELKTISENDQTIMLELLTSEQIKQTYMLPDFETKEDAIPLFRRLMELSVDQHRFVRGIFAGETLVGFVNDVEIKNGSIELGYVIHPKHWGKGYGTAALREAIGQLFAMGYRNVIAGAFSGNTASIRVMEKAGMKRQEKTDEITYRGRVHSCVYYSIRRQP